MRASSVLVLICLAVATAHAQTNPNQPVRPTEPSRPAQPGQPVSPRETDPTDRQPAITNRAPGATNIFRANTNRSAPGGAGRAQTNPVDSFATNQPGGLTTQPPWATNVRSFWFTNYPAGSVSFPTSAVPPILTNITAQTDPDLWLSNWWWFSTNRSVAPTRR